MWCKKREKRMRTDEWRVQTEEIERVGGNEEILKKLRKYLVAYRACDVIVTASG